MPKRIKTFQGKAVHYIETTFPNEDVECDIYEFENDKSRDLAVIEVNPNAKTPLQKVKKGDVTIEGFISGSGVLTVNGKSHGFAGFDEIVVHISDVMQWTAGNYGLVFYEICEPPYTIDRFELVE